MVYACGDYPRRRGYAATSLPRIIFFVTEVPVMMAVFLYPGGRLLLYGLVKKSKLSIILDKKHD